MRVKIVVEGGVATVIEKSKGVSLIIEDKDAEETYTYSGIERIDELTEEDFIDEAFDEHLGDYLNDDSARVDF